MNRDVSPAPILRLLDEDNAVDPPASLPIGAFPLLESLWPAGTADREKPRVIARLLQLVLHEDSDLESPAQTSGDGTPANTSMPKFTDNTFFFCAKAT